MTNAQKWILSFLGVFVILLVLTWITMSDESNSNTQPQMSSNMEQSNVQDENLALFSKTGCVACHGADLTGTAMAPSLVNVKEFWKRDALINYLRNPSSYSTDKRFVEYKQQFKSIMPSYNNVDVKDLGKMADYLLQLK